MQFKPLNRKNVGLLNLSLNAFRAITPFCLKKQKKKVGFFLGVNSFGRVVVPSPNIDIILPRTYMRSYTVTVTNREPYQFRSQQDPSVHTDSHIKTHILSSQRAKKHYSKTLGTSVINSSFSLWHRTTGLMYNRIPPSEI